MTRITSSFAAISLAVLYRRLGDLGKAREFLQRAKEIEPENGYILVSEGQILYKEGRLEEAKACFQHAERRSRNEVPALVQQAQLTFKKNPKRGRDLFKQALAEEPYNVKAVNTWAEAEFALTQEEGTEDFTEAEELLNSSLAIDRYNAFTLRLMSRLYLAKRDPGQSEEHRIQAHKLLFGNS